MERATADANDAQNAYEELEGQIDDVAISLEKYVTILKTLDMQHQGFEKLFTQVPAFTQTAAAGQQASILQAQLEATKAALDQLNDSPDDKTADRDATRKELIKRQTQLQSELNAVRSPANQALRAQFDEQEHGLRGARNLAQANDYGMDATDKLLRQREALQQDLQREDGGRRPEDRGRALEEEHLLLENGIALAQRRAEVEKEINQLYYDRSREFRKNTLGGGPEQLLRTLAAFRTAYNDQGGLRNISPGQLMSMGPDFRSAVTGAQAFGVSQGKQLPQGSIFLDPQMMELMQEKGRLQGFAGGGYTGDGPADEIAGVVHRGEFVIPRAGLTGEESMMDDYAMRKVAERNRLPHGDRLQVNRNWMEDQFEELSRQEMRAGFRAQETLPGNLLATENIPGFVSRRQRELKRTPMVAKAAALPAGLAAIYGAMRLGLRGGGGPAEPEVAPRRPRPPISAATFAARTRYEQSVRYAERSSQFGEMFRSAHIGLVPRGSPVDTYGSGMYHPQGIPLDDFGHLGPMRIPTDPSWGATPHSGGYRPAVRGFSWGGLGANLAHMGVGAGVTMGLNWAGGKINPALGNSDTYTGAGYGLFTDAAGGAVAGARGGPLGVGIGAVSGMAIGTATRLAGGIRDIGHQWVDSDKTNQQVSRAQQELLRVQRNRAETENTPPMSRSALPGFAGASPEYDRVAKRADEAMAAADAAQSRWHKTSKPKWNEKFTNPATGLPWSSGQDHSIEGRGNIQHPTSNAQHPITTRTTTGTMPPPPGMPPAPAGPSEGPRSGGSSNAQEANGCLELSCKLLGEFNTGLANATTALERFTAGLSAPPRAAGGAPSVPQGGGMGGAAGYRH